MQPRSRKYLYDIRRSAEAVLEYTKGRTFDEYIQERYFRSAVERELEIIGEAISQMARIDPDTASGITNFQQIIAFRNVLIHGYSQIEHDTVWDVIVNDLPIVIREVEVLLREFDESQ